MGIRCFSDAYGEFLYKVYSSIDNPDEFNFSYSRSLTEVPVVGPGGFCSIESAIDAAKEAMDKDSRADFGQYDIVCEGHTTNGMKFQIVTDNQNKDKGYGFAVDICPCFNEDYTAYKWGYPTLYSVFEEIESTYSENYEKCKFLNPGGYALVRLHGKEASDLIAVSSCNSDSVTYTPAGSYKYQTSKLKDVVVLPAVITPWSDARLESYVGCVFRRIGDNTTQLAVGTYSAYDITYLNLAGKERTHGESARYLATEYEIKTADGWKPCYNIKWEE